MAQTPLLNETLREEYMALFATCRIKPEKLQIIDSKISSLVDLSARYQETAEKIGVPWWMIALIHLLEGNCNFRTHLHNGDPLTARTSHVPKGRPVSGSPPFSWEESAIDALTLKGFDKVDRWDVPEMLFRLEGYNGWGYRMYHQDVKSPYLWSMSNHYVSGKYVADGKWSQYAVSEQIGAAVMIRRMVDEGIICLSCIVEDASDASDKPLISEYAANSAAAAVNPEKAKHLQRWLNTFDGINLTVDGWAGKGTSDAYKRVTGHYLPGDPREVDHG